MNEESIPIFGNISKNGDPSYSNSLDLSLNREIVTRLGESYSTIFNIFDNDPMNGYGGLPNPGGPGFTQGLRCDRSEPPGCNALSYHMFCCTNKASGCADPTDITHLGDCNSLPPYPVNQCNETGLCESVVVCNSDICDSMLKCEDGDTYEKCFNDPRILSWWQELGDGCYFND